MVADIFHREKTAISKEKKQTNIPAVLGMYLQQFWQIYFAGKKTKQVHMADIFFFAGKNTKQTNMADTFRRKKPRYFSEKIPKQTNTAFLDAQNLLLDLGFNKFVISMQI